MHGGSVARSGPRRGSILVVVLVSLLVASMLGASLIRTVVVHHRQMRILGGQQQAFWLAEAGVQRAEAQLSKDAQYNGETWPVPAGVLGASRTAEVKIQVTRPDGQPLVRAIRVEVVLDDGRAEPAGCQREYRFHVSPEESGKKSGPAKAEAVVPDTVPSSLP